jgi:hypothetical protein
MSFQMPEDLSALEPEALDELHATATEAAAELLSKDEAELSDDELAELENLADAADQITAEKGAREAAAAERSARVAAAKGRLSAPEASDETEEPAGEADTEAAGETEELSVEVPDDASALVEEEEREAVLASAKTSKRDVLRRAANKAPTPKAPVQEEKKMGSLIAAADVAGLTTGAEITWDQVYDAFGARLDAMVEGTGKTSYQNRYPIARLKREIDPKTFIRRDSSGAEIQAALTAAMENFGLPATGDALVATGGWAAPSPINYELPVVEEAPDGLLTLPTVTVERGGFQHTLGVNLETVVADSNRAFTQTEAQAIAATVKPFLTMGDVTFQDERLSVIGHGMRAKFLTLQGYPELVKRYVQLANLAYIKYKNADLIARVLSNSFTAVTAGSIGSVSHDLIDAIALQANRLRYKYTLKRGHTFTGIAPFWLLDVIREDLAKRAGWDSTTVPDSYIIQLLAQRGLAIQFVRDWAQDLGGAATAYPATAVVYLWEPGVFVEGGSPVVSFDAMYDYTSLTTNTYTAFFAEESRLVAKMKNIESVAITVNLPITSRYGRTGDYDLGHTFTA